MCQLELGVRICITTHEDMVNIEQCSEYLESGSSIITDGSMREWSERLQHECPQQDGQTGLARVRRLFQGGHFLMHGRRGQLVEDVRATACGCLRDAS